MYYIILIVLSGLIIWISMNSNMLRNTVFNDQNFQKIAVKSKNRSPKPAYSLGRTQLAFWTVIVVSSFIYLLISQSVYPDIQVPVLDTVNLTLISIAAGTTLVSKAIDISQNNNQGETIPQQDYPSEGFFIDIISDETGVSIHRLQNVIWTVVVGGIYIVFVSGHTTLPNDMTLTPNLLTLMGISTTAYLGLKLSENKSPVVNDTMTNESLNDSNTPSVQQPTPQTFVQPATQSTPAVVPATPVQSTVVTPAQTVIPTDTPIINNTPTETPIAAAPETATITQPTAVTAPTDTAPVPEEKA